MGGGMGGGSGETQQSSQGYSSGSSHSEIVVPEALQPLYKQSASNLMQLQNMMPLWGATQTVPNQGANPVTTALLQQQPAPIPAPQNPLYIDQYGEIHNYGPGGITAKSGFAPGYNYGTYGGPGDYNGTWYANPGFQYNVPGDTSPGVGPSWAGSPLYNDPATLRLSSYSMPQGAAPVANPGPDTAGLIPVKNSDGTISYYRPADVTTQQTSPNFLSANPMQVAGLDPLQQWASGKATDVYAAPENQRVAEQYGLLAPLLAGRMATGQGVSTDPAILAASEAFEKLNAPTIENQMGLSGLGKSSSLANALAMSKTSYMLPLIQDYIKREQDVLTGQANMYASLMPQFAGLGSTDTARQLQAINAASQLGATNRAALQDTFTSQYQDFLRRQALAEQALFVPFGATATASIGPKSESQYSGTQTSQGSGSQSSGMFK